MTTLTPIWLRIRRPWRKFSSNILAANKKYTEAIDIAEKAVILAQRAGNKDQMERLNQIIIQLKSKRDEK